MTRESTLTDLTYLSEIESIELTLTVLILTYSILFANMS